MEIVGWVSSVILLCTLVKQVYKQWKEGTKEGVSKWLFTGQLAASIGFTIYSVLTGNIVFIVTNSLLVLNSIVGIALLGLGSVGRDLHRLDEHSDADFFLAERDDRRAADAPPPAILR